MIKAMELWKRISRGNYKRDYANAKARGLCLLCGGPAKEFRDASARLEYAISALCQNCQDEYLNGR